MGLRHDGRDRERLQRFLDGADLVLRRDEHGDVARAERALPVPLPHPNLGQQATDLGGHERRDEVARLPLARHLVPPGGHRPPHQRRQVAVDQGRLGVVRGRGDAAERDAVEQERPRGALEDAVDGLDQPGCAAPVGAQGVAPRRLPLGAEIGVHVGPAKSVDGLLRVADEVERVALEGGPEDAVLERVGVLELVDQGDGELAADAVRERRPGVVGVEGCVEPGDEVVEGELPAALLDGLDAAADLQHELADERLVERPDRLDHVGAGAERRGLRRRFEGVLAGLARLLAGLVDRLRRARLDGRQRVQVLALRERSDASDKRPRLRTVERRVLVPLDLRQRVADGLGRPCRGEGAHRLPEAGLRLDERRRVGQDANRREVGGVLVVLDQHVGRLAA